MRLLISFFTWLALTTVCAYGHHILCVFPVPSRSHNNLAKGIVDSLLRDGHEVTWATPYPNTVKNASNKLHIVDVSAVTAVAEAMDMTKLLQKPNTDFSLSHVRAFSSNISKAAIQVPALRDIIVKKQFDGVVSEWFFSDSDCGYAAVQQVPWVLLSGTILLPNLEKLVDEVRSVAMLPLIFNDYPIPMNFWQRLVNNFMYLAMEFDFWRHRASTIELYESTFKPLAEARGVTLPAFDEALYNVSAILVNSHPSFVSSVSFPPNVFNVAGYHISEEIPPLPKDLQDLLDNSAHGVIYFSMGSVLKSAGFPDQLKKDLVQIFGQLRQTVLWKFEKQFENLPKNVHIRPWMPQPSILAHPNVKLFITHGGLLSSMEALNFGVPVIAIPIFGDQPSNAARAVRLGYASKVTLGENTAKDLKVALDTMLSDDRYYNRAKFLSKLFRDRPVHPSRLVAHVINLAIESKGALHLRSKAKLYSWYQRWMLDQLAFLLAVLFLIIFVIKKAIQRLCGQKTKDIKLKKK